MERVSLWSQTTKDETLLDALLSQGLKSVRGKNPELILGLAKSLLGSSELVSQRAGIRLLFTLLEQSDFENIPVIYRLLTPLLLKAPIELTPDLSQAIQKLARISPTETTYFLKQIMGSPAGTRTALIIRQSLIAFPPDLQSNLRSTFSGKTEESSTI